MSIRLLCIALVFIAFGCKSDSTSTTPEKVEDIDLSQIEESIENAANDEIEVEVKMDELIDQNELAKKMIIESKKEEVAEEAKVENKVDVKLEGKSEEQKQKEAQMKMEATKEIIDSSPNKGLTCEQILEEQKKFIDDFESTGDRKIIVAMAKKQNDPFFKECSTQESFRTEIDALATRLEEIMDKM